MADLSIIGPDQGSKGCGDRRKGVLMTAERAGRVQEPTALTGDVQDPPEPRLTDGAGRSGESLRPDRRVLAKRDWGRCAVVRFVQDVETAAPFDEAPTRYRTGERMRLWQ